MGGDIRSEYKYPSFVFSSFRIPSTRAKEGWCFLRSITLFFLLYPLRKKALTGFFRVSLYGGVYAVCYIRNWLGRVELYFPWLRSYICGVAFLDYQHQGLALAGDYPNSLVGRRSLDGVR